MKSSIELVEETNPTATLTRALLLWTLDSKDSMKLAHASLNEIVGGVIQPAKGSLSIAQLRGLNSSLQGLADERAGGLSASVFPPNLLYFDPHQALTAWWRPARRTPQFFECEELGTIQGVVPMPSLVFLQAGVNLSVCAVAGSERPTGSTRVFHAPLFNMYEDGGICLGDVDIDPVVDFDVLERNEAAFLHGINTHPNGHHKKTAYPAGVFALWRDLIADPTLEWDDTWLVPMGHPSTLSQWLAKA